METPYPPSMTTLVTAGCDHRCRATDSPGKITCRIVRQFEGAQSVPFYNGYRKSLRIASSGPRKRVFSKRVRVHGFSVSPSKMIPAATLRTRQPPSGHRDVSARGIVVVAGSQRILLISGACPVTAPFTSVAIWVRPTRQLHVARGYRTHARVTNTEGTLRWCAYCSSAAVDVTSVRPPTVHRKSKA
jgi:hypothetical protein